MYRLLTGAVIPLQNVEATKLVGWYAGELDWMVAFGSYRYITVVQNDGKYDH